MSPPHERPQTDMSEPNDILSGYRIVFVWVLILSTRACARSGRRASGSSGRFLLQLGAYFDLLSDWLHLLNHLNVAKGTIPRLGPRPDLGFLAATDSHLHSTYQPSASSALRLN